jgi:membrane associated rhomboid family serine protease
MLIPIGTNVVHKRYPMVTFVLIGLNLLVFAVQWSLQRSGAGNTSGEGARVISEALSNGRLSGTDFHLYSLITYQFLHAGWMHIIGNMLFLLPFGKAVEDRMGHLGFALFYLGCGAFGGFMHTLYSNAPVVGASGSVCAVTAAFIVLAPKTTTRVLVVFFIIGLFHIPSMLLVAFFVLFDVVSLLASMAGANAEPTAWIVHLAGYVSGFGITFLLLKTRLMESSEYDLTEMLKQAKRRREFRQIASQATTAPLAKNKKLSAESTQRMSISETAGTGNLLVAADEFLQTFKKYPKLKLNKKLHATLGNALIRDCRFQEGAQVYERYLKQHGDAHDRGEIALLLIAKYCRNLDNKQRGEELLEEYQSMFSEKHALLVATLTEELRS